MTHRDQLVGLLMLYEMMDHLPSHAISLLLPNSLPIVERTVATGTSISLYVLDCRSLRESNHQWFHRAPFRTHVWRRVSAVYGGKVED